MMALVVDLRFRKAFGECKQNDRPCITYNIDTTLNVSWKFEMLETSPRQQSIKHVDSPATSGIAHPRLAQASAMQ